MINDNALICNGAAYILGSQYEMKQRLAIYGGASSPACKRFTGSGVFAADLLTREPYFNRITSSIAELISCESRGFFRTYSPASI